MFTACGDRNYHIANSSNSPDEAVMVLLNAIQSGEMKAQNYYFDQTEFRTIYYPEFRDYPSIISKMEPEEAWEILNQRQQVGLIKIKNAISGKQILSLKIKYKKKSPMKMKNVTAHFPDVILITTDKGDVSIEEIGVILENHKTFKIANITTG